MSVTPEQFVAVAKTNVEASLKTTTAFATAVFTAVERISTLNLATSRAAFDDAVAFSKAAFAAQNPQAIVGLSIAAVMPAVEKSVAYGRSLGTIAGDTQDELTKLVEAEVALAGKNFDTTLENLFKNAPAGSEAAVSAVKTAVANANAAYEGAAKAAKQVAAAAQASVQKATEVAVQSVEKSTKAAATALKVA